MKRWVGRWMIAVGALHTVIGFLLYGSTLREIVGAGVWDSLNPGRPARYLAFWFMFAGVAAMLIGYLADWIEREASGRLPRGLGWTLLGVALVGAIVTPISGFWLVFPPALGALARSRAVRASIVALPCVLALSACRASVQPAMMRADGQTEHLSAKERVNLDAIRAIHEPGKGLIQRLRDSGLLADSAEWWVAGPPDALPFAGTWRGLEGIAEFQRRLGATMRYDTADIREYLVSGENVAAIFRGVGTGRATGISFSGEIIRLYTFGNGKIVRVRNFYDTGSYLRAVQAQNGAEAARLVRSADSLATARGYAEAANLYAAALAAQPDSIAWARRASGTFWRAGRFEDAYRATTRAQQREPDARDVLFNMAITCGFLIELDCVDSNLRRSTSLYPQHPIAHGELAFLAQAKGDLETAVQHARRAYEAAPEDDFAVSGLVQMLIPAGKAAEALPLLEARLHANRQAPAYGGRSMRTLYGWALLELGDTTKAYAAFDEVLGWLDKREQAGQTTYQLYRERAAIHSLRRNNAATAKAMATAFDRGWRLYAAWTLVDPMFANVMKEPAVTALIGRMRADAKMQRQRLGLN